MKAIPYKSIDGRTFEMCLPEEATHVTIRFPGPVGSIMLPVMIKGTRKGTGNWTWNGDTEKPTLRPSVLTKWQGKHIYHSWVNNGMVRYLNDTVEEFAGKTMELLDNPEYEADDE